ASAILSAGLHPMMPCRDAVDITLLPFDLGPRSFEHERQCHHLIRLETLDLRNEEFLGLAFKICETAARFWFQRQSELELEVIHKPHARRWRGLARHVEHEFETIFERGEQYGSVLLDFGERENLHDG